MKKNVGGERDKRQEREKGEERYMWGRNESREMEERKIGR